jgi:hypothetical protein
LHVGIWRHDLYDVDRLLSRTVGYTLLTGGLVAVFAVVTVGVGAAVGRGSDLAVAVATMVCAVLFGLLRRRVQSVVDASFDRGRRDALDRLDEFVNQIRDGRADPGQVESALQQALHDPGLRVVYKVSSNEVATWNTGAARLQPVLKAGLEVAVAGRVLACIGYDPAARRPRLFREALRRAHLPLELAHHGLPCARRWTRRGRPARLVEATDAERRPSATCTTALSSGWSHRMSLQVAQQRVDADDPMQPVLAAAVRDLREAVIESAPLAGTSAHGGLDEACRPLSGGWSAPARSRWTSE